MPKVTKISKQQRKTDWCSVFVDGKYTFSLPITDLFDESIKVGQELSPSKLAALKKKSQDQKLYDAAILKLSRRAHSTFEIEDYLRRKKAEDQIIDHIIKRLKKYHYLDDQAFAENWIKNRRELKSSSTRQIKAELFKKRVPQAIIDNLLFDEDGEEIQAIKQMIAKKRRISRYQDDKKLIAYLAGKGFNYGDIKTAISSMIED